MRLLACISLLLVAIIAQRSDARIAFVSQLDDPRGDIYTIELDDTGLSRLTLHVGIDREPIWSPDGSALAFASYGAADRYGAIYVVASDGQGRRRLSSQDTPHPSNLAWSPDGSTIGMTRGGIHLLNTTSGSVVSLPTVDDDGSVNPSYHAGGLAWSPDGSQLAFSVGNRLYTHNLTTGEESLLVTVDGDVGDPEWSPDGESIVFEMVWDIYLVSVGTGEVTALTKTPDIFESEPSWSGNSTEIVYAHAPRGELPTGLHIMSRDGRDDRALTRDMPRVSNPTWLRADVDVPPARPMFEVRYPPVGVELVPGTSEVEIHIDIANHTLGWAWSLDAPLDQAGVVAGQFVPEGESALVGPLGDGQSYTLYLALADAAGRLTDPAVVATTGFTVGSATEVPTGSLTDTRLVFVGIDNQLYSVPYIGGNPVQLTDDGMPKAYPVWSRDGSTLAYSTQYPWAAYSVNADGSMPTQASPDGPSASWAAVSPDGSRILFASTGVNGAVEQLYVANRDGSDLTQLTDTVLNKSYPSWSPAGTRIAFVSSAGTTPWLNIMDPISGAVVALPAEYIASRPDWSPDGAMLVYGTGNKGVSVVRADGRDAHSLGAGEWPVWSPDGTLIAFTYDHAIHVMDADGGNRRRLFGGLTGARGVAWSPFLAPFPRLAITAPVDGDVIDAGTGRMSVSVDIGSAPADATWEWSLEATPSGTAVANGSVTADRPTATAPRLSAGRSYLLRVELTAEGGRPLVPSVTDEAAIYVRWPVPDGDLATTKLAFVREVRGDREIFVSDPDGSNAVRLTHHSGADLNPDWSPDGRRIAYSSDAGGSRRLMVMNADGTDARPLTTLLGSPLNGGGLPDWSPDGSRIAYSDTGDPLTSVYAIDVASLETEMLVATASAPSWSPDGSQIAFVDHTGVWVASADGSKRTAIAPNGNWTTNHAPSWSPNGTYISYVESDTGLDRLHLSRPDGRAVRSFYAGWSTNRFAWSPDGRWLLRDGAILRADGSESDEPPATALGMEAVAWSTFTSAAPTRPTITVVEPRPLQSYGLSTQSVAVRVDVGGHEHGWTWRLDAPFVLGEQIDEDSVTVGSNSATASGIAGAGVHTLYVTLVDLDRRVVPDGSVAVEFHVAALAEPLASTRIAFVQNSALWTMRPDGTDRRRILRSAQWNSGIAWSPDGEHIAYLDRTYTASVMRRDGTGQRRLHASGTRDFAPTWEPTGATPIRFRAILDGRTAVFRTDLAGATLVEQDDGWDDNVAFSPDGTRVAYRSRAPENWLNLDVYVANRDGSAPVRLTHDPGLDGEPVWSPDGAWIAYVGERTGDREVYLIRPDGSDEVNLTDDPGEDYSPTWAPDGSRIAFTSQRDSRPGIYTMAADGSDVVRLSHTPSFDGWPAWSPLLATGDRRQFTYAMPPGLSILAPTLDADTLAYGAGSVPISADIGLRASHLIEAGATLCLLLDSGRFVGLIGRDGEPLGGEDFALVPGRGYLVNMPRATTLTMAGEPAGVLVGSAPAAEDILPHAPPDPWAFVLSGAWQSAAHRPAGVVMELTNERTGRSSEGPLKADGTFLTVSIDLGRAAVVKDGDVIHAQPRVGGYQLGDGVRYVVGGDDTRDAFALIPISGRPGRTRLLPNFPNPFNPDTWMQFDLAEASEATVRVYDVAGHEVRRIDLGYRDAGFHRDRADAAYWDGRNELGEPVASGIYVCQLQAGAYREMRRMLVRK